MASRNTDEYIWAEFYKRFYPLTTAEQNGIIRGLETIRDCKPTEPQPAAIKQSEDDEPPMLKPATDAWDRDEEQRTHLHC